MRRNPFVDEAETGGISVAAADPSLRATVGATLRRGTFLNAATGALPGGRARRRGGQHARDRRRRLARLARRALVHASSASSTRSRSPARSTRAALIGFDVAADVFGADGNASTVYVRADQERVSGVRDLLGRTANPQRPEEVDVSRPSDALEARAAAKTAFTSLFLGLGAVALLVGGVGIANVMVISVLERRSEIGLRRALGATRRNVGVQFLAESLLLAGLGGAAGTLLGALVTVGYATSRRLDRRGPAGRARRRRDRRGRRRRRRRPLPGPPRRPPLPTEALRATESTAATAAAGVDPRAKGLSACRRRADLPPGPREPTALQTVEWIVRPTALLRRAQARYGEPFTLRTAWSDAPLVLVCDPAEIKRIYAAPPDVLQGGESSAFLEPFTGPRSVLILHGDEHLRQRR